MKNVLARIHEATGQLSDTIEFRLTQGGRTGRAAIMTTTRSRSNARVTAQTRRTRHHDSAYLQRRCMIGPGMSEKGEPPAAARPPCFDFITTDASVEKRTLRDP